MGRRASFHWFGPGHVKLQVKVAFTVCYFRCSPISVAEVFKFLSGSEYKLDDAWEARNRSSLKHTQSRVQLPHDTLELTWQAIYESPHITYLMTFLNPVTIHNGINTSYNRMWTGLTVKLSGFNWQQAYIITTRAGRFLRGSGRRPKSMYEVTVGTFSFRVQVGLAIKYTLTS